MAMLWSPSTTDLEILERDWTEHVQLITTGHLATIDAKLGIYLQVRPKGANAASLCDGFNEEGEKIKTMPRGFYLRSSFTGQILSQSHRKCPSY